MQIPTDTPEPEHLAEIIKVEVSRVRLEADPRWHEVVERLETSRVLRRIGEAVHDYLGMPRDVLYEDTAGILRPRRLGESIDLRFIFSSGAEEDHYEFRLKRIKTGTPASAGGVRYEVKKALKMHGEPWGGGVVPETWKEQFLANIRAHPVVWQLSERIVRLVEPEEVTWEWQPSWNLHNILVPQSEDKLHKVFRDMQEIPKFTVLATWGFTLDEHDWGANGHRVQLLIDPFKEEIVAAWEEEWHVLY